MTHVHTNIKVFLFARACHLSLSWARWIRSTRFLASFLKCILISFHLCQDPQSCLFLQVFQRNTLTLVFFLSTPTTWKRCVLLVAVPILRFALFWDFTQRMWVVLLPKFLLSLECGTYRLSRNVCNKLRIYAA